MAFVGLVRGMSQQQDSLPPGGVCIATIEKVCVCLVPFVTGPYCDINPLYLANTSCTYSCSGCSERCLSWVDLEVNCCWSVPILYIKKFPPTHPGEVDCRPPLAVWCVFASAIEQYSPSQKDLCAGLELVVVALD